MKKSIAIIFVLIMTISTLANAQGSAVFTVEPFVNEGIVEVEISYKGATDLCYGTIDIQYDNTKLEVIEIIDGEAIEGLVSATNKAYSENIVRVGWASVGAMPENGVLYTITFKQLSDDFTASDIKCTGFDVGNTSFEMIEDATISVAGVEDSVVTPAEITVEIDYEEEYKKYIQSILGEDVIFVDGLEEPATDSEAAGDETLPVDKAEDEDEVKQEAEAAVLFDDVKDSDWFFESVKFAKDNGLMGGVSETKFAPEEPVTRAMLVVILHRLEGTPEAGECEFADVAKGEWYTDGIAWAAEQGIVNGVSDAEFAPDSAITREQIAAIMYRYAQAKGVDVVAFEDTNILSFDDAAQISEYAVPAMQYACGSGLIGGKTATTVNPQDNATRAEIATILMRYLK